MRSTLNFHTSPWKVNRVKGAGIFRKQYWWLFIGTLVTGICLLFVLELSGVPTLEIVIGG